MYALWLAQTYYYLAMPQLFIGLVSQTKMSHDNQILHINSRKHGHSEPLQPHFGQILNLHSSRQSGNARRQVSRCRRISMEGSTGSVKLCLNS